MVDVGAGIDAWPAPDSALRIPTVAGKSVRVRGASLPIVDDEGGNFFCTGDLESATVRNPKATSAMS